MQFWKFLASKVSDLLFRPIEWVSLSQLCPRAFRGGVLIDKRKSRQKLKADMGREDSAIVRMRGRQKSSSPQKRTCLYFRNFIFFTVKGCE